MLLGWVLQEFVAKGALGKGLCPSSLDLLPNRAEGSSELGLGTQGCGSRGCPGGSLPAQGISVSMGYNRRCPGKSRDGPRRSPAALLRSLQRLNSTELLPSPSTPNPDPEGSQPGRSHARGLVLDRDRAEARKGTGIWGNDVFRSIVEPFRARPGERGAAEAAPAPSLLYLPAINTGLQIPINYPQIPGWNGDQNPGVPPALPQGRGLSARGRSELRVWFVGRWDGSRRRSGRVGGREAGRV